jgi:hypothetical protein
VSRESILHLVLSTLQAFLYFKVMEPKASELQTNTDYRFATSHDFAHSRWKLTDPHNGF